MSFQITTAHVQQYKANVELLLQQLDSRFRMAVDVKSDYFGKGAKAIEQIGVVEATQRTVRHGDVVPVNTPHAARWLHPNDWDVADYVDDQDKLRTLYDPTGFYAQSFKAAHNRRMDRVCIDAFFGNAMTGENGTTATPFPGSQLIANGGTGMTVAKLRTARQRLRAAEVPEDEPLYCALSAEEENDLLGEIQVVSLDYNDRPVLVDGRVRSFMGFNFIHSELLLVDGSGFRRCPAWAKSGMHVGIWQDVYTSVDKIATKGKTMQVYTCATYAATRTQELKVIEIVCA